MYIQRSRQTVSAVRAPIDILAYLPNLKIPRSCDRTKLEKSNASFFCYSFGCPESTKASFSTVFVRK